MNIAQSVEHGARLYPDRPALQFEGETVTYHQLDIESNRAANGFTTLGIQRGDSVAIWLPNTTAFVSAYLGLQKLGAIAVTINTALTAAEVGFILNDSGAQLLITTAAQYDELSAIDLRAIAHIVVIEGERAATLSFTTLCQAAAETYASAVLTAADPGVLLYTSGTTGFPKGALLSHGAVLVAAETAVATFGLQPDDRVLIALSMFHSFAQTAALVPALVAGATLLLHRQFELEPVLRSIQQQRATCFFGVPTLYILLQANAKVDQLKSLRRCISAGASLPVAVARQWQAKFGKVINEGYGLTESCLGSFNHNPLAKPGAVGQPLAGVRFGVINEFGEPVAPGELGEIIINTPSIMLGYWNRPAETALVLRNGWFHTGDIGRVDADGNYYIIDRVKDMVNVGGVKVYPSEVENVLYQHPAVSEVAVYGVPETLLGEQVHAQIVLKPNQLLTAQELLAFCHPRLAEFKLPSVIHFVEQLPKSRTGKILKRILREQEQPVSSLPQRNGAAQPLPAAAAQLDDNGHDGHQPAATAIAQWLAAWLADQLQVAVNQIDWEKPFADYGMTSVMAVNLARALGEWLGQPVQAIMLWNFPTIETMAAHLVADLARGHAVQVDHPPTNQNSHPLRTFSPATIAEPIALIGIGCRFPGGATTPDQFWQLLRDGVDTVRPLPATRWDIAQYYDPNPNTPGKTTVRAGSFLEDIDQFDAHFFNIPPLEAATIDPQQRLLLEVCWEALEHANQAADQLRESRTGVYVGSFWDDYSAHHLYNTDPAEIDSYRLLSNLRGMTAGRLAYVLGLHGPAMQLDTACSSSLLAVHLACQALRTGECNLALAGGVNLLLAPEQLIGLSHMGAVAPDGRCKTFAAEADGFGIGEGVGIVVLKRLADAVSAGDRILGVIRGSAVNHDGASNGLTAPNGRAQEAMLRQALENAQVHPAQIQYVETHGTGTVLGDPIEVQALLNVLCPERTTPLLLGSVKTNIGHLSGAAGIAALIKVVLALHAGEIPPNLHFATPNPLIPWQRAPIAVPTTCCPWPLPIDNPTDFAPGRRLAGVSSFGLTGTNVHLIVEAAPPAAPATRPDCGAPAALVTLPQTVEPCEDRPYHLLTLSAKSEQALRAQIDQIEGWLALQEVAHSVQANLADICYTAATSRAHLAHRLSIIAPDLATARTKLREAQDDPSAAAISRRKQGEAAPKIAFLFPGQGPQYVDMGRQLYATEPSFRQTLDRCDEILRVHLGQSLLTILYGADKSWSDARLNEATYAQPALFALEYALATLWRTWGVEPAVLIGHSMGEYAAACLAGVFSLADGLKLVAARGRLMQEMAPQGQMVAVLGHEAEVRHLLAPYADQVSLAAINTPQSLVIAGSPTAIHGAEQLLRNASIETRPLKIYVASHSPLMEPILAQFAAVAKTITYHHPQLSVISNVTGTLAAEELTTPAYWVRHLREPVRFAQGMATIAQLGIDTFIETGPKATLLGLGQQCLPDSEQRQWLPSIHPKTEEWPQMLASLATLHGQGATIDWHGFDQGYRRRKVDLPRYPFQRQRYWLDEPKPKPVVHTHNADTASGALGDAAHPLLGRQVHSALAARNQELLFAQHFDLAALPYLADHTLFDQPIVPGAAYLEMILAAGAQLWPQRFLLLQVASIQQPLLLPTSDQNSASQAAGTTVQIIFTPAEAEGYQWQIYSLEDGAAPTASWTLHASGKVAIAADQRLPASVELAALRAHCDTAIDLAAYDEHFRAHGITYGPAFQALTQLFVGDGEALGYVTLPQSLVTTANAYHLHPVLLDAALRVASSLLPATEADPYLPFSVEGMEYFTATGPCRLWSHIKQRGATTDSQQVDLTLFDEDGCLVARLTNFTLRRANRMTMQRKQRRLDWLYALTWQPAGRPGQSSYRQEPGGWLILADRQGYGDALAARLQAEGAQCLLCYQSELAAAPTAAGFFAQLLQTAHERNLHAKVKLRGVVYLWGLDTWDSTAEAVPAVAQQLSIEALTLVQALLHHPQTPRLWLITQAVNGSGAPVQVQQAVLWGLGRTLQWEEPALACTCVDLPADPPDAAGRSTQAQALFAEVWFADDENQVRLAGETRLVARLGRHRVPASQPLVLDQEGSYLVTGGLGGLGLQVAQWLADQGARHLVLAGRRGATTPAAQRAIEWMQAAGAQITVVQADMADQAAVRNLVAISQGTAPLRGIIHAAGILDDGLLLQQTPARFAAVMAPKVAGSWHLHTLTRTLPLDFFVCFSSVSALLGNRGQSNYAAANAFMDALAHQRHHEGQPALSINWGGWAEVGLAATLVQQTAAAGLGAIAPAQGVDLLGLLLTDQAPQVGVLPIQWRTFQQSLGSSRALPLLTALLEPVTTPAATPSLRHQLTTATAAARYALIQEQVEALLLKLLGTTPAADESFLLFGLDSLMSIQLANRLAAAFGLSLPATLAFKYETVARLTQFLLDTLANENTTHAGRVETPQAGVSDTALADWYPQLYNQRECYIWHEAVSNKACLHIPQAIYIRSAVDPKRLAAALQRLVDRHEALRTIYTRRDTELLQKTLATQSVDFAIVDLGGNAAHQPWSTFTETILAAARAPFNLAEGPLLRGRLYCRAAADQLLLLVVHHIAADATALSILVNELWTIYAGLEDEQTPGLPPVSTTWTDFVRRQRELLSSTEGERLWHYWQTQLAGELAQLQLPTDYPPPTHDSHQGRPCAFELDAALVQQLRHLAQQEGCTLYMVLMAAFQLLLHQDSAQRDLIVAAHVANRNEAIFAEVVGYLADTFPIRTQIAEDATFQSILQAVQVTILGAMEHQGFPMRLMAERLGIEEQPSRPILCQVWFTLLPLRLFQESGALFQSGTGSINLGGLELAAADLLPAWLGAWYDLEMILTEGESTVFGTLVYKTEIFTEATILCMIERFQTLLKRITANPTQPITQLTLNR